MTDQIWFLAFIVMPAAIIAGGFVALRLHQKSLRHHTPAE